MAIIDDNTKQQLKNAFENLKDPVVLHFFKGKECLYCNQIEEILTILEDISPKISVKIYDFEKDKQIAENMNIKMHPAIIIHGLKPYNVRFFGIPSGYEFSTFIEDIIYASIGYVQMPEDLKKKIKAVDKPLHLQVFVTPTCPYCPRMVSLVHKMAFLNPNITADMIEAIEFPDLSNQHSVTGVPKTVINGTKSIIGAYPEPQGVGEILKKSRLKIG